MYSTHRFVRFLLIAFTLWLPIVGSAIDVGSALARPEPAGQTRTVDLVMRDRRGEALRAIDTHEIPALLVFPPDETFDGVIVPALPPLWSASNSGAGQGWVTTAAAPFSSPNAAFTDDTQTVTDKFLMSPLFVVGANARVTFRQKIDLESNVAASNEAYDGVALEISTSNGAQDILAAGGSFVSGGYDHTTSSDFGNPLAGRAVWSGTSQGYQKVVVNLPAATNGQEVILIWHMGTDISGGRSGYWLDDVHVDLDVNVPFPPDETFGEVIVPDLPRDWINDSTGPGPGWITVNDIVSSAPNAAFTDDSTSVSDKRLETPAFTVVANGRVTFNHKVELEDQVGGHAFDGVVLEIAYGDGPFVDFASSGGTFVVGGYDHTVLCGSNPLCGRSAWSGSTPGFVGVVANLPPDANGQSVRLRWRMGTDDSQGLAGYWLDDVHVDVNGPPSDRIFFNDFECAPSGCP
ncbi:MAG: hypothetical protein ABIQ70_08400 [Dokdonella sp.]